MVTNDFVPRVDDGGKCQAKQSQSAIRNIEAKDLCPGGGAFAATDHSHDELPPVAGSPESLLQLLQADVFDMMMVVVNRNNICTCLLHGRFWFCSVESESEPMSKCTAMMDGTGISSCMKRNHSSFPKNPLHQRMEIHRRKNKASSDSRNELQVS